MFQRIASAMALVLLAYSAGEAQQPSPDSVVKVEGVTAIATGAPQKIMTSTAAVGVVTGRELRDMKVSHPSQIMSRIPGVYVSVAGSGEGHMTAIRQPLTTTPVYLYLEDGVPTRSTGFFNHNALYEVNVPQAGRIEVLKGPGTALYGSDAIGGVINVETQMPSKNALGNLFLEGGSHTWTRALASFSDKNVRADVNVTKWGGWRDNADYDRQNATLRWDTKLGAQPLKTVLAFSRIDQLDASALNRTEWETTPELNYYLFTTRKIRAFRASTNAQFEKLNTQWSVTPYVRDNQMDLVPFFQLAFDPTMYTTAHRSAGVLVRGHTMLNSKTHLTGGVDVDYSPGRRKENQITMTKVGKTFQSFTQGGLVYDYDVTFHGVSPYLQAAIMPAENLHIDIGARYDRVGFNYDNHLDDVQTGRYRRPADTRVNYDELSPKVGAAWEIKPWLATYASYRQSFRSPSESQIFRQGSSINTTDLKPIIARSKEAGVRGMIKDRVDYEVSAYDMHVQDDVLTYVRPDGQRETQNAGETQHRGIEVGAGLQINNWVRLDAAQSWSHQTYVEWTPRNGLSYAGHEIPVAPKSISNVRVKVKTTTLEWVRLSRYFEDPENTHMYEGHSLLNLNTSIPVMHGVNIVGRVINLANKRYAETASYTSTEGEQLQPGAPRLIYIGIQGNWSR